MILSKVVIGINIRYWFGKMRDIELAGFGGQLSKFCVAHSDVPAIVLNIHISRLSTEYVLELTCMDRGDT